MVGEFFTQVLSINNIPVVGYGKAIGTPADYNRLSIDYPAGTPSGVTSMTNGNVSPELR